ncbi:putative carboxypeptidase [Auriculariales sp. MPI-PUGE-AT-0066]|nr:putative carboxypeptidase [Auriculariales sp. MPI-PUGE-AT-0066]
MKLFSSFAALLSLLVTVAVAVPTAINSRSLAAPYAGIKVLRVPTGPSETALKQLESLIESLHLESWTTNPQTNSHVDLQVPADRVDEFISSVEGILANSGAKMSGFGVEVMHEDLAASIEEETQGMFDTVRDEKGVFGLVTDAWFDAYHTYADHLTWINDFVSTYPNNSKVITSGTTVQGRTITGKCINIFGSAGSGARPAIIWHGTVHAREWIGTMVVEYLAYQLASGYATSTTIKAFVDKYDFHIFPVVNPDGFAYTQSSTRLWRKNRQTPPSGSSCYGRDINRNWATSSWNQSAGASTSPCAEDYKGLAAADAPETQGLQAYINARASSSAGAKMFVDWHSYSQLFMTPYGYTCSATAPDATELNSLAAGFATALRVPYGTRYTTGPICTTIYQVSGGSTDYTYINSKVKYSFAAELRDTGSSGFVLPAAQIRPSGAEVWAGVQYLLTNIV